MKTVDSGAIKLTKPPFQYYIVYVMLVCVLRASVCVLFLLQYHLFYFPLPYSSLYLCPSISHNQHNHI